jgi:hypothetical protein
MLIYLTVPAEESILGSFAGFPNLPSELRVMIWERAVVPRKITYYLIENACMGGAMRTTTKDDYTPVIFHVNRESRAVAAKIYLKCLAVIRYKESQAADGSTQRVNTYLYISPSLDIWINWRHRYNKPMENVAMHSLMQHVVLTSWNLRTILRDPTRRQLKFLRDLKKITIVWNAPEELSGQERTDIRLLLEREGNWTMPKLGRRTEKWRRLIKEHKKNNPDWHEPELSCARIIFANDPNKEGEQPPGWRVDPLTEEMTALMI